MRSHLHLKQACTVQTGMVKSMQIMNNLIFSLLRMTFSSKFKTSTRGQETGEAGGRELALALQWHLVLPVCRGSPEFSYRSAPCTPRSPSCRTSSGSHLCCFSLSWSPQRVCGSRERLSGRLLCVTPGVRLPLYTDSTGPRSFYLSSSRGGDSRGRPPA